MTAKQEEIAKTLKQQELITKINFVQLADSVKKEPTFLAKRDLFVKKAVLPLGVVLKGHIMMK